MSDGNGMGGVPQEKNQECDIVFFHHLAFTSTGPSPTHGTNANARDWYERFDAGGGDLVLVGHNYSYERFIRQDINGNSGAQHPRQFTVGTGGNNGIYPADGDDSAACWAGDPCDSTGNGTGSQALIRSPMPRVKACSPSRSPAAFRL